MAFHSTAIHLDGDERIRASVQGGKFGFTVELEAGQGLAWTTAILTQDEVYARRLAKAINGVGFQKQVEGTEGAAS